MYAEHCRGTVLVPVLLALLFLSIPLSLIAQDYSDQELAQKLIVAEGHHDLAVLYIKKGEFDKAVTEARQIIQLRFTGDNEKLIAESFAIITEKLADARRFDLGQGLLDEALRGTEQNTNRVKLLRNKARLYVLAGDNDKAIDSWRKALDLEQRIR